MIHYRLSEQISFAILKVLGHTLDNYLTLQLTKKHSFMIV